MLLGELYEHRNTLIQEAIAAFAASFLGNAWPESILNFKAGEGFSNQDSFEYARKELKEPSSDIF